MATTTFADPLTEALWQIGTAEMRLQSRLKRGETLEEAVQNLDAEDA